MEPASDANPLSREGKPWTAREDQFLLKGIEAGEILEQLNVRIKRSIPAIVRRLAQLAVIIHANGVTLFQIQASTGLDPEIIQEAVDGVETTRLDALLGTMSKAEAKVEVKPVVPKAEPITPKAEPVAPKSGPESAARKGARWTDEEDAKVLEMVLRHVPRESIASALGRSGTSITYRLCDLGAKMVDEGQDLGEVATKLGLMRLQLQESMRAKQHHNALKTERAQAAIQRLAQKIPGLVPTPNVNEDKIDQLITLCTEIRDILLAIDARI